MIKSSSILRRFYPSLVWKVKTNEKKIYLTFDDGPIPEITEWVLDELRKYHAKATFFCIGENVAKHPNLFSAIVAEKHLVGNHTFNHLNGWETSNLEYFDNIEKANQLINSNYFRPPYGKISRSQIKYLKSKYKIIMWDLLSYDFDIQTSPDTCFKNATKNYEAGSIIVFHDSLKAKNNLYNSLPQTLNFYSKQGYSFETLEN